MEMNKSSGSERKSAGSGTENRASEPESPKKKYWLLELVKKAAFSVWAAVMAVGMFLAFLISLLLL